jgi:hypothetical protein
MAGSGVLGVSNIGGSGGSIYGVGTSGSGTVTPKRKCSFSSFSECRLLEEGGSKHHTFLFSIEAPSPPPTPQMPLGGSSDPHLDVPNPNLLLTASQRRRRFSQASLSAASTTSTNFSPWVSRNSSCSPSCSMVRLDVIGGDEGDGGAAERQGRLRKSGSIMSLTSQVCK